MLRPTAKKVNPDKNFCVVIEFDNGEVKRFDVKPYIKGAWFGQLKDTDYFSKVMVDGYTICWPNGQDLCPDELYELSVSV